MRRTSVFAYEISVKNGKASSTKAVETPLSIAASSDNINPEASKNVRIQLSPY